jgi:murein DD-endopeptidase
MLLVGFVSGCGTTVRPLPVPIGNSPASMTPVPIAAPGKVAAREYQPELPDELFGLPEEVSSAAEPAWGASAQAADLHADLDPGERVLRIAQQFVGSPYRKGGASPDGFDCSGLVYYSYRQLGRAVPRTSATQHQVAQTVPLDSLRAGDLLFFRIRPQRISHVGIFVEGDLFLHATSTGKSVTYSRLDDPYWKKRLAGAGRLAID